MGVIISLTLDDGEEDRPHRENLFKPDYQKVGIACGPHKTEYQMCVMDFAYDFEGFHDDPIEFKKNFNNTEKLSPELGLRNVADLSLHSEKLVDKKASAKNSDNNSNPKESAKFLDPLTSTNYSQSTNNKNKTNNSLNNYNNNSNNIYDDTFGNRNLKNNPSLANNMKENIKTQANTNSLNNFQSPLVRLSLDKDDLKNEQKSISEVNADIENLTEIVKNMNTQKRIVSKHVEVTTKIVYTFEDGSTKEVVEKQNHTFAMDNI